MVTDGARAALLLSIHSRHAQKILSGEKRLEFRRVWPSQHVSTVIIYATAPVKRIVAIAKVRHVHRGSADRLCALSEKIGGGVPNGEITKYLEGRAEGFAIEFESVKQFAPAVDPKLVMPSFQAPQSFKYIDGSVLAELERCWEKQEKFGRIVLVSGVHGVGKTTMSENFAKVRTSIYSLSGVSSSLAEQGMTIAISSQNALRNCAVLISVVLPSL